MCVCVFAAEPNSDHLESARTERLHREQSHLRDLPAAAAAGQRLHRVFRPRELVQGQRPPPGQRGLARRGDRARVGRHDAQVARPLALPQRPHRETDRLAGCVADPVLWPEQSAHHCYCGTDRSQQVAHSWHCQVGQYFHYSVSSLKWHRERKIGYYFLENWKLIPDGNRTKINKNNQK